MNIIEAVRTCFQKYNDFSGRARRAEYWWWVLFTIATGQASAVLDNIIFGSYGTSVFGILHSVIFFIPGIAVTCRRLHDINKSGWWMLAVFVMASFLTLVAAGTASTDIRSAALIINAIFFITYFCCLGKRGTSGSNRFGEDPLT